MRKLQSLKAWTHARVFSRAAYRATLSPPLSKHFGLADQMRRAAASIPANIAEGYALATRPQLVRCLRIAYGETCELICHIELASEMGLLPSGEAATLNEMGDLLVKLLLGLLKKLTRT